MVSVYGADGQTDAAITHPTAASRTTVTGTFSFLRASAICRLNGDI